MTMRTITTMGFYSGAHFIYDMFTDPVVLKLINPQTPQVSHSHQINQGGAHTHSWSAGPAMDNPMLVIEHDSIQTRRDELMVVAHTNGGQHDNQANMNGWSPLEYVDSMCFQGVVYHLYAGYRRGLVGAVNEPLVNVVPEKEPNSVPSEPLVRKKPVRGWHDRNNNRGGKP